MEERFYIRAKSKAEYCNIETIKERINTQVEQSIRFRRERAAAEAIVAAATSTQQQQMQQQQQQRDSKDDGVDECNGASFHLDNVSVENSAHCGVTVYGTKRNTMKNCNVSHSKRSGLYVYDGLLLLS